MPAHYKKSWMQLTSTLGWSCSNASRRWTASRANNPIRWRGMPLLVRKLRRSGHGPPRARGLPRAGSWRTLSVTNALRSACAVANSAGSARPRRSIRSWTKTASCPRSRSARATGAGICSSRRSLTRAACGCAAPTSNARRRPRGATEAPRRSHRERRRSTRSRLAPAPA